MNELRRERKRDVITTLSHRAVAFTATIYILCEWPVCFNGYILILRTSFAHTRVIISLAKPKTQKNNFSSGGEWLLFVVKNKRKNARFLVDTFTRTHTRAHTHAHAHDSMRILRSRAKLLSVFLVLFLACAFLPSSSLAFEEFEDKDKLMDELDRLKTFTETRIKNKETVLRAKKDAWDREEKLDKSLDGLELEDKLEKQFEADLEQVRELGLVGNRRMLQ